jgi:hypothetical protein
VLVASNGSLTVTVPIRIKRRGLRISVTLPDRDGLAVRAWDTEPTPRQLALGCRHRWLAMLGSGEAKSLKEIAQRDGVGESYLNRLVNLTALTSDSVGAVLGKTLPPEVALFELTSGGCRCCGRNSRGGICRKNRKMLQAPFDG